MKVKALRGYLGEMGITAREFCNQIGYNEKYFSRAYNGKDPMTKKLSDCVNSFTDGIIRLSYDTKTRRRAQNKQQQQINSNEHTS